MTKTKTKEKKEKPEEKPVETPVKSVREILWHKFLENYKISNPVKHAVKEEAGAFTNIPASFVGKTKTTQVNLPDGTKGSKEFIY